MYAYDLNKRALEGLIKSGAFDSLGYKRSQLLAVYEKALESVAQAKRKNIEGQMDLFGMGEDADMETDVVLPNIPERSKNELLMMEKESTGLYLSGHPMDAYRELSQKMQADPIGKIQEEIMENVPNPRYRDQMQVKLGAVISSVKLKTTKNGSMMAYVTAEDLTGSMELIVFSSVLNQSSAYLKEDQAVIIQGRIDAREEEAPKLIVSAVYPLEEQYLSKTRQESSGYTRKKREPAQKTPAADKRLFIKLANLQDPRWPQVQDVLSKFPGTIPVILYLEEERKSLKTKGNLWVREEEALLKILGAILGQDCVKLIVPKKAKT